MSVTYLCDLALVGDKVQPNVAVTVDHGRFVRIVPNADPESGFESGMRLKGLSVPGLANAHSHAFHRALRSRTQTDRGSFWTWRQLMYRAASKLEPDLYFLLARATFAEMALAGITAVGEFHYVHHRQDGSPYRDPNAMGHALLRAATDAGIRITLIDTIYLHGGLGIHGYEPPTLVQQRYNDASVGAWIDRVDDLSVGAGQKVAGGIHSVRAVDPQSMKRVARWAEQRQMPLHAHVSEQPDENNQSQAAHGATPTEVLHHAEALGPRFTAVHATHPSEQDIAMLSATGSQVCLCPTTESDLGDGIGPSSEMARAGVSLCIGTDSNTLIDMWTETRSVEWAQRAVLGRRAVHSASELIEMVSSAGHRSLGWPDAGHLTTGSRADLVTIGLESARLAGTTASNALEAAVFACSGADISSVMVDGVLVVENGRHQSVDVGNELTTSIGALMDS